MNHRLALSMVLLVSVLAITTVFVHSVSITNCCLDAYLYMYYFGYRYDTTCHVFMPSDCNCEDVILTCEWYK